MFKKAINFIKYNNAALLIFVAIFLIATGALATETGRDALGSRDTRIEGMDNTLLLEAQLDKMDMDFTIEKLEEDENYYYATYTYIDLIKKNEVWQYQMVEKGLKVTKKLKADIGEHIAEELSEVYEKRIRELTEEQKRASEEGESKRVEISEFDGLLGATLDVAGKVFPDYEPVTRITLPSPVLPPSLAYIQKGDTKVDTADNMTETWNDWMKKNDPDGDGIYDIDGDGIYDIDDNCPEDYNPKQRDYDDDNIGDVCDPDFGVPDDTDNASSTDQTTSDNSDTDDNTSGDTDTDTGDTPPEDTSQDSADNSSSNPDEPTVTIKDSPEGYE